MQTNTPVPQKPRLAFHWNDDAGKPQVSVVAGYPFDFNVPFAVVQADLLGKAKAHVLAICKAHSFPPSRLTSVVEVHQKLNEKGDGFVWPNIFHTSLGFSAH